MATFEELKVPKSVIDKIRLAAQEDESLAAITTPDGLKEWLNSGNELSKAVSGIGDTTENKVREVLGVELKAADQKPKVESDAPTESEAIQEAADSPASENADQQDPAISSEQQSSEDTSEQDDASESSEAAGDAPAATAEAEAPDQPVAIKDLPNPDRQEEDPEHFEPRFIDVTIRIPVGALPRGKDSDYAEGGKVQFGRLAKKTQVKLTPELAKAFICVREGLLANNDRLDNGEPVVSNADVVRWLMMPVAEAIASEPGEGAAA